MTDTITPTRTVLEPVGFRLRQLWILFAIFAAPVAFMAGQAVLPVLPDDFVGASTGMPSWPHAC